MKRPSWFAAPVVAVLLLGLPALSSQKYESASFGEVLRAAFDLAQGLGIGSVVLIYDLDNTLLRSNWSLGSDQWFNWQSSMLKDPSSPERSRYLAAPDFDGLVAAQSFLHGWGSMAPPESSTPLIVRSLQNIGFKTMVVTSRGPEMRPIALRELTRNGYDFSVNAPAPGLDAPFVPLPGGKEASYVGGVYMTNGQDKGRSLLALWERLGIDFRGVVFLDDGPANIQSVCSALDAGGRDVRAIRYSREDNVVSDFKSNRDRIWDVVKAQWEEILSAIRCWPLVASPWRSAVSR